MKIICMGDSITYGFGLPDLSKRWSDLVSARTGHVLINRGVSGDTTGGMLARCQTQVFDQAPDAMVLLGGINDISITGQYHTAFANVISMFRQADLLSIPVILGVPLPICPEELCPPVWEPDQSMARLAALAEQYADLTLCYAADKGLPVADFRTPFLLPDGRADRTLFQDCLHPTEEGHRRMADVLCQVLAERF
ncbi:GDSL-type esterase/lipase family protein [Pseudoflavonifractor phocaeensis]|uniref:GDSL-type esterase/lipase family protein n=1 Tax=Pseudoflavonifractor phocaeensis TaxID=1870988 RepID=UPI001F19850E|nr:GDSL-type esterase/lipase family protein [Pseudoflavonifractor phocaeensis]MCF2660746.1 hypothetical protein [Pseudoflavonifractor phocaeensis]